jgi:hypothetical protein
MAVKRRTLLTGYTRLPGSSKRILTPEGKTISDRAYHTIATIQRLQSGSMATSKRAVAVANKAAAKETIKPVNGQLFSILSEDGSIHRARFDDAILKEAYKFRTAISQAYASNDLSELKAWRKRHPEGLRDVHNKRQRFLSTKSSHKKAWGNMSERTRARLEERYAEERE